MVENRIENVFLLTAITTLKTPEKSATNAAKATEKATVTNCYEIAKLKHAN